MTQDPIVRSEALSPGVSGEAREIAGRDDDAYWDYDEDDGCANCGGEGFVYGCSWDWQCETYDEGEGTCLCTRPCDWCSPRKPNAELQAALADALAVRTILKEEQ